MATPKPRIVGMVRMAKRTRPSRPALAHMMIQPTSDGGHIVSHHFNDFSDPQQHLFPKNKGQQMLSHVGQALGISQPDEGEGP